MAEISSKSFISEPSALTIHLVNLLLITEQLFLCKACKIILLQTLYNQINNPGYLSNKMVFEGRNHMISVGIDVLKEKNSKNF